MSNQTYSALEFHTFEQDDGAIWRMADIENGHVTLTSRGHELRQARPELENTYVPEYIARVLGQQTGNSDIETRKFIASGANSSVYELAPRVAVKEASKNSGSTYYAVRRMDRLMNVIETSVPRWIDMPHIYGMLEQRQAKNDYIAQQKIDSGITVEWLLKQGDLNELQSNAVGREFGIVSEGEQDTIGEAFVEARDLVANALEASGEAPDSYLVDYHEGNIIVERLRTPIADKRHKFWIIDQ